MTRAYKTLCVLVLFALALSGCIPGGWAFPFIAAPSGTISAGSPVAEIFSFPPVYSPVRVSMIISQPEMMATLQPVLKILDTNVDPAVVLDTLAAENVGESLSLQNYELLPDHAYQFSLEGLNGTTGDFNVTMMFNASLEIETDTGYSDDMVETGQPIDSSFMAVSEQSSRGAVFGNIENNDLETDVDRYTVSLQAGEVVELAVDMPDYAAILTGPISFSATPGGANLPQLSAMQLSDPAQVAALKAKLAEMQSVVADTLTVELLDSAGTELSASPKSAMSIDGLFRYTIAKTGMHQIVVRMENPDEILPDMIPYEVVVLRGAAFEQERNDTPATAQAVTPGTPMLGYTGYSMMPNWSSVPALLTGKRFTFGVSNTGTFHHIHQMSLDITGITFDGTAYLSETDAHTLTLRSPLDEEYTLHNVLINQLMIGKQTIFRIMGSFTVPVDGGGTMGVQLAREISMYAQDNYATVHTTLSNPSMNSLTGYSLVERYNPAPDGDEVTTNTAMMGGDLLAAAGENFTLGIGSPESNISLGFDPGTVMGEENDAGIEVIQQIGNLDALSSTSGLYYLIPGEAPVEAVYTGAAAQGYSLDDYYSVTLTAGVPYKIQAHFKGLFDLLAGIEGEFSPSLEILNASGTVVASQDGDSEGGGTLQFMPKVTGAYKVRVSIPGNGEEGFDYVLRIESDFKKIHIPFIRR